MATRRDFADAMIEVYRNHGVYIGTANGELTESLTVGGIRRKEVDYGYDRDKTNKNIRRDFAYIGKCYEKGWDMSKSKAGDCSGIPVGELRALGIIPKTADYNCRSFMKKCTKIPLDALRASDLVFNKKDEPSHMGVFDGEMVVESKGRDDGVVRRPVSDGPWVIGGRLPDSWFDDDPIPPLTRNLYYRKDDLMKGEDVLQCQERLVLKGYNPGTPDGVYGKKSRDAVILFQRANGLEADGIVGQKTWGKLWEN